MKNLPLALCLSSLLAFAPAASLAAITPDSTAGPTKLGSPAPENRTSVRTQVLTNAVWYRLYLGMGLGKNSVSPDVMRDFLTREVTPRFPEGLCVTRARGQWNSPEVGLLRENNTVVDLQCADTPECKAKIDQIADAYTKRFKKAKASVFIVRVPGISTELRFERD